MLNEFINNYVHLYTHINIYIVCRYIFVDEDENA